MKIPHSQRIGSGCYAKPTPPNCGFFEPTEIFDDLKAVPVTRLCFFYEDLGKDAGSDRWRVCFYYESHQAFTKFFYSEEQKNKFLAELPKEGQPSETEGFTNIMFPEPFVVTAFPNDDHFEPVKCEAIGIEKCNQFNTERLIVRYLSAPIRKITKESNHWPRGLLYLAERHVEGWKPGQTSAQNG